MSEQTEAKPAKKPRVAVWIATGFGLGYLPVAPGTWGSLGGVVVAWIFSNFMTLCLRAVQAATGRGVIVFLPGTDDPAQMVRLIELMPTLASVPIVGLAGVWASRHMARYLGKSDPGQVVIDEISGQQITYLPLGALSFLGGGWKYVLLGFILFRIFDIVKPWPARAAEKWPNGWGIMADDWFAGGYAAIILWVVHRMGWLR